MSQKLKKPMIKSKIQKFILLVTTSLFLILQLYTVEVFAAEKKVNRIFGEDRYLTASEVSDYGWENRDYIIIANGTSGIDSLTGSSIAGILNSPILFCKNSELTEATKDGIVDLKARNAIILGGEGAVGYEIENELIEMGLNVKRIGGQNRYETAALIGFEVENRISKGIVDKTAILVNGYGLADALTASFLSSKMFYPTLLTLKDTIPEETKEALKDLGINKLIIVGGEGVISNSIDFSGFDVVRVFGNDRYETNNIFIQYCKDNFGFETKKIVAASGNSFADALVGGNLAAKLNSPLLLVNEELPLNDNLVGWYEKEFGNIFEIFIIGGTGAISEDVETWLKTSEIPEIEEIIEENTLGPKRIEVSISKQRLYAYEGEVLIYEFLCSTGTYDHPTPKGNFKVTVKSRNAWSRKYSCWMPFCLVFYGTSYTIHELPITSSGRRIGRYSLGRRASHGCIRLGIGDAENLFNWAEIGTPVIVY